MSNRDSRTLSPAAQYEIRRQAIKLYQSGHSYISIGEKLEVHRNTIGKWVDRFKAGGMKSLAVNKRGPKEGTTMQLSATEQQSIRKQLIEKEPDQLKLPFALWTREAVGLLIKKETEQNLDLRQVGRYLKRWGFTPQRPAKQAYQRCDKKVAKWIDEEYPTIKEQAEHENAEIHWADETGIKSHNHRGRGFAPKGNTPVRKHNAQYEKVNMISSVTNQGKLRFMCYDGSFTYQVFHQFLSKLITDSDGRKVIVIVDNLRVHHSKVIKRWLKIYRRFIEVYYLPSYSPDLNPDEFLNCDLKTELAKRPERRQKGQWRPTVEKTMQNLASKPDRVASYFQAESIRYAM